MKKILLAVGLLLACTPSSNTAPPDAGQGSIAITGNTPSGSAVVWPDEQFRYQQPQPQQPRELNVPPAQRFELDSGLDVVLVSRTDLPTVSMWMSFPTGSVSDPKGKRGRTSLCMSLMSQGTAKLDKIAFEEKQADLAVSVWANSGSERVSTGVSSLARTLEPALDLWIEMLRDPGMREDDLKRLVSARKASLAQNRAAPRNLARRLWPSVVMGPEHPYGRLTTERDYTSISRKDCQKFASGLGLENATLFVAGAMTKQQVIDSVGSRLSDWKGATTVPDTPSAPAPRKAAVYFADVPGAKQSQLYVGHPGPMRTADDYEANRLNAAILGGSFSGRVNMNLREDKGFAYGARARFSYYKHAGVFAMTSSVRGDATADALGELLFELRRMRTEPVSTEELAREQDAAIASLPALFDTSRQLLSTYASLSFYGLPLDYYAGFVGRISDQGIADLRTAARNNLNDSQLSILVVGDGEAVLPSLQALADKESLGPVVMLDPDGHVVKTP
ncbi:MAG: M16 family metallopeptidase [Nannocystales bacterium]